MDTYFAPAQRTERRKFTNQLETISHKIRLEDNRWILIYAQDVARQQFWINLERIFFHDINNVLTSSCGNVQLLEKKREPFLHSDCIDKSLTNL